MQKENELLAKVLAWYEARKFHWKDKVAIENCKKQDINSEKLQAKLAFPSKLPIMYFVAVVHFTLFHNCQ